ncbi:MAG: hypothetical protein KAS85_00640 [Rhodobacteraceae bacterium]|nr:hypothetical protein [Paracoccaceae bacterium]
MPTDDIDKNKKVLGPEKAKENSSEEEKSERRLLEKEESEFRLLEVEVRLLELKGKEHNQRYILKWISPIVGIAVLIAMFGILYHVTHSVFFFGKFTLVSSAFSVAIIVAPIASITAITIALFYGAFGKLKNKSLDNLGNGVTVGTNLIS